MGTEAIRVSVRLTVGSRGPLLLPQKDWTESVGFVAEAGEGGMAREGWSRASPSVPARLL